MFEVPVFTFSTFEDLKANTPQEIFYKINIPESTITIRELIRLSFKDHSLGSFFLDNNFEFENRQKMFFYNFERGDDLPIIYNKAYKNDTVWLFIDQNRIIGDLDQSIQIFPDQVINFIQFGSVGSKLAAYRILNEFESYLHHFNNFFDSVHVTEDVEDMCIEMEYIEKELQINFSEKFGVGKYNFLIVYKSLIKQTETKFLKTCRQLIDQLGEKQYLEASRLIFKNPPIYWEPYVKRKISNLHRTLLLSLSQIDQEGVYHLIEYVFKKSEKKIPYQGQSSKMLSTACKKVLENFGTKRALQTCYKLERISHYTSFDDSIKLLVGHLGLSESEVEELKAPSYEFDDQFQRKFHVDNYSVTLTLAIKNKIQKSIVDEAGNEILELPKMGLEEYQEEIAEIQYLEKNVPGELRHQRNRIENTYQTGQSWYFSNWNNLYIQNPIVAYSAQQLIWHFSSPSGQSKSGIWKNGDFVDSSGQLLPPMEDNWTVKLWHPIEEDPSEVSKWKDYIFYNQITQPFKQAFREIYTVTPPELVTRTFSNRFAAHILYKQQFAALASSRGWAVPNYYSDNVFNPFTSILGCGIEFRMDASWGDGQTATTNEVVFDNRELHSLPAIVFSEAMRDIDMFVSVSSIGVDPTWTPEKSNYQYWSSYTTGELSDSAVSRKELLERIVPGLIISEKCSLEDRWLRVNGTLGSYRIHIGSGSVHMDPSNKHICIVPQAAPSAPVEKVYLPFEGDMMLSLILSKAFLLAYDNKIKDPSILSQIRG